MIRYRLDDLGWYHFECLVQAILKARLGLTVQAWGGWGDWGRDAYAPGYLEFPIPGKRQRGPFLFQVKFVEGANAAGAKWNAPLMKGIRAEVNMIRKRMKNGSWRQPRHYVLVTNAPLTASVRDAIEETFIDVIPGVQVTTLGAGDICAHLDEYPSLRRSFPEIMSLRDLDMFLSEAVNKTVIERSLAALNDARELIQVFVPTRAYERSWEVLHNHFFVVLDGPPEMGKTAIARTIGLVRLADNWEIIDCRGPDDFFSSWKAGKPQMFMADDAFGRTEFDVTLGRQWERDLPRILPRLDERHWLIWTTRKHILARALKDMDLVGRASRFPEPGEIIVTADDLLVEEKARMLYRHSKAAHLLEAPKEIVRNHAVTIVKSAHFTPERVRRFVADALPRLVQENRIATLTEAQITREVTEAIRNPTKRMRAAFRSLPDVHKWLLISLIDTPIAIESRSLKQLYEKHRTVISQMEFSESLDHLDGTFIKQDARSKYWQSDRIDWIHPSYRDLVIDELTNDLNAQVIFLERASVSGVKLALSDVGGASGFRAMPLMGSVQSWTALRNRCRVLAQTESDFGFADLMRILANAVGRNRNPELLALVRETCDEVTQRWNDSDKIPYASAMEAFADATKLLDPPPQLNFRPHWEKWANHVRTTIDDGTALDRTDLRHWTVIPKVMAVGDPALAHDTSFQEDFRDLTEDILASVETDVFADWSFDDPEDYDNEADHLESLTSVLEDVVTDSVVQQERVEQLISEAQSKAGNYRQLGRSDESDDWKTGYEREIPSGPDIDLNAMFADL